MSLLPCLAKLQRDLRDFDTSDVRDAAKVYASRGMEDKAANIAAVEDHLRELRQARQRVVDQVLSAWKERDPEGYAKAQRPALDLKGESEGEIRTREAQQAKKAEQQRRVANAPSEKGFTLTGSDLPADEAEARGQKAMFSRGNPQAKTPEFKAWFRDSKVVDEHGEPLVVYHGTTEHVSAFSPAKTGLRTGNKYGRGAMFFTSDPEAASAYATTSGAGRAIRVEDMHPADKPNVTPAYLSLQRPLELDAGGKSWTHVKDAIAKARQQGYDGVIVRNVLDHADVLTALDRGPIDVYVAFKPEQINSAVGNRGAFDATSRDITYRRGVEEPTGSGMKEQQTRAALKGAIENTKVPIRVVQSVKDLPFEAPADAKGAFHDGKIWAVADNLADALDAEKTIARHEVTHAGMDILYGDSRSREVALTKVVAANPKVRELARAWRDQYGEEIRDQAKAEGMKPDAVEREVRLASFEEGLAHFAEEGNEIRGWQQFVAVIQKGLRSMGLDRVADWIEHATNAEAMSLLDVARKATREESMPSDRFNAQPAFARKPNEAEQKADVLQMSLAKDRAEKVAKREAEPLPEGPLSRIGDALAKTFAPATRGKNAGDMAGIMRSNFAQQARGREIAEHELRGYAKTFDKMTKEQNYEFIAAMEGGRKLGDQKLQMAADAIRKLLDGRRDQVIALGKGNLENFNENYFPHIWKDPSAAKKLFGQFFGKRPLQGSKAFLKQRTFDTFRQGLDAGMDPISSNPVELALLKAREMDRYIYGQRVFGEMKLAGLAKFVRFGDKSPDGWQKINDSIARVYSKTDQGTVIRGEYYAPEQAATLINNHLSPGFSGNAFFDAWRGLGNAMNSAQLGLGAFHLGFTTLDAMISRVSLGIKQTSRGILNAEPGEFARGAGTTASGLAPWQAFSNLVKGDKLLKAYLGDLKDPNLAPIVEALVEGGGRARMDPFYRVQEQHNFREALKLGRYGEAAKSVVPRIMDAVNWPIFEYLVPRQKLGVFFDMAQDAIRRNPDMTLEEKRSTFGKLWDSVDNRMGEMVYDNLFWNRALKDSLMASVRSVGWNLGTFREIGGGVKDVKSTFKRGELSDRTAYIAAMVTMTGVVGSMVQYAYTGEAPQSMKDLFFPRTGGKRPDGSPDRVSLPSYMKDLYEYGHDVIGFLKHGEDPTHTIKNKMHPLLSTVSQILNNEDFFGGAIRSPGDPAVVQAQDELKYLAKQLTPFGIRNYIQKSKAKHEDPSVAGYLTSGQFYGLGSAPGYIVHSPEQEESLAISHNRDAQVKKFRQELKDGTAFPEVAQRMRASGMSQRDIDYVRRTSGDTMKQRPLKHYNLAD